MTKSISKIVFNLLLFVFSAIFLFVFQALAKDNVEDANNQVSSSVTYIPSRSAEKKSGKIGITEIESEYSHTSKLLGELPIKLSLNSQYISIDKSVGLELPSSLTGVSAELEATFPFLNVQHLYLNVDVIPSFYGDSWSFESSSFRIPSRYVGIYRPNDQWTWLGGIEIFPKYQDKVLPILGVVYTPNDRLSFDLNLDNPNISYSLNNKIDLFLEGRFSVDEFVVEKDNASDVILRYTESRLGSGIKFKINKSMNVSLSAGEVLNNVLKYRNSEGKVKIRSGLYFGVAIEAEF